MRSLLSTSLLARIECRTDCIRMSMQLRTLEARMEALIGSQDAFKDIPGRMEALERQLTIFADSRASGSSSPQVCPLAASTQSWIAPCVLQRWSIHMQNGHFKHKANACPRSVGFSGFGGRGRYGCKLTATTRFESSPAAISEMHCCCIVVRCKNVCFGVQCPSHCWTLMKTTSWMRSIRTRRLSQRLTRPGSLPWRAHSAASQSKPCYSTR